MAIIKREDIDRFFDYDISVTTRTIYMGSIESDLKSGEESGVNAGLSERAIKALHLLDQTEGNITIILNLSGGDVYHGFAIYDAIKSCKNRVIIKVFGMALSMGAIILQAGDERILSPNSKIMIHHGYMGMDYNHTKIFQKWAEEGKKTNEQFLDLLMEKIKEKNPNFKRSQLNEICNFDTILTSKEAIDLGLADKILE